MSEIAETGEGFIGRIEEQSQFREALRTTVHSSASATQKKDRVNSPPDVFLIYGEGGMGKTELCRRFMAIATSEPEFKDRIAVIGLDWEKHWEKLNQLDAGEEKVLVEHDAVRAKTVFNNIYTAFCDAGFGDKLDPYERAVTKRTEAEKKVAQALDATRGEGQDRYADLRKLGAKGLAWLVRTGLPGGVGAYLPEEPTTKAFEAIIEGGVVGLAHARDMATTLIRAKLDPGEFDLFVLPNETLAHKLADGIHSASQKKPILLVLDFYEFVERADFWLRTVIQYTGPRVIWVISGRHNLTDGGRRADIHFRGYREDELLRRLLHVMPLIEFSAEDVMEYFEYHVPARPLDAPTAQAIQYATRGVPLAVKEAAAIWAKRDTRLNDITSTEAPSSHHDAIVEKTTKRFLMRCWDDPKDLLLLFTLALAYFPDTELLAAMLNAKTTDVRRELNELEKRYSLVLARNVTIYDKAQAFIREYLLADVWRKSEEIRGANERAIAHLNKQLAKSDAKSPTLEDRVHDEEWAGSIIALAYHSFWLNEDDGWKVLLPAYIGGLAYDPDFARTLLDSVSPLSRMWHKSGLRRFKILQVGLSTNPGENLEAALLGELESSPDCWVDDGCLGERRAILALLRGRVALHEGKLAETQLRLNEAEKGLPPTSKVLKRRLGVALYALSGELMWPHDASDAVYSADAKSALAKAAKFFPDMAGLRYYIGVSSAKEQVYESAITEYKAAINLDPSLAAPHNGLGNVYYRQGHYVQAIPEYQTAVALDPKDAAPHNGLGNVYYQQHLYDQAIREYQTAIHLDPKLATPYNGLSYAYRQLDQYDQAIREYQTAIDLDSKLAAPHNGLGNIYLWQGHYEQAIDEYRAAIDLDPQYATPHRGLGDVYRQQGRIEQARAEYGHAFSLDPNTPHTPMAMNQQVIKQWETWRQVDLALVKSQPEDASDPASLTSICRKLDSKNELDIHIQKGTG